MLVADETFSREDTAQLGGVWPALPPSCLSLPLSWVVLLPGQLQSTAEWDCGPTSLPPLPLWDPLTGKLCSRVPHGAVRGVSGLYYNFNPLCLISHLPLSFERSSSPMNSLLCLSRHFRGSVYPAPGKLALSEGHLLCPFHGVPSCPLRLREVKHFPSSSSCLLSLNYNC